MPRPVVFLVHGTFATNTQWLKPGSALRQELHGLLGDSVQPQPFYWSGVNTHKARRQAGATLAMALEAHAATEPDALRYLVGHSHGGNVALYALRDEKIRRLVHGVASFNTPYITCGVRPVKEYMGVTGTLLALGFLAMAGFTGWWAAILLLVLVLMACRKLTPRLLERRRELRHRIQCPSVPAMPMKIAADQGDVVGAVLRVLALASSAGHRIWNRWFFLAVFAVVGVRALSLAATGSQPGGPDWRLALTSTLQFGKYMFGGFVLLVILGLVPLAFGWILRRVVPPDLHKDIMKRVKDLRKKIRDLLRRVKELGTGKRGLLTVLLGITLTVAGFLWVRSQDLEWRHGFDALATALVGVIGVVLTLHIIMLGLPRILRSHKLGFGWEAFGTNWLLDVDVDDQPRGRDDDVVAGSRSSWFGHDLYDDEGCVETVAKWICEHAQSHGHVPELWGHLKVSFARSRNVEVDGVVVGKTNEVLRVARGARKVTLGRGKAYTPKDGHTVDLRRTTKKMPREVSFEDR